MEKIIKIISLIFSIVLIGYLIFGWYQNKKNVDTKTKNTTAYEVIKIGDKDDYYELTIPKEFYPIKYPNGEKVLLDDILYPQMKRWSGERIENVDRLRITIAVTYNTGKSSRLNSREFALSNIKKFNFLTKPNNSDSKSLIAKYPDIEYFTDKKENNGKFLNDYFVFKDKNGFTVIASDSYGDTYRVNMSFKERFEIMFFLPRKFFSEMPEVTNAILDLISTFNPKHYKNGVLQQELIKKEATPTNSKNRINNSTNIN